MISQKLMEQAEPIITKIAKTKSKTKFAYFTGEDVSQEVWIICLKALEEYTPNVGPIENFLRVCVNNRLMNLKRDKYFRPIFDDDQGAVRIRTRINLVNAIPLGHYDTPAGAIPLCSSDIVDPSHHLILKEMIAFMENNLDEEMLADFKKLKDGQRIPRNKAKLLEIEVRQLIKEFNT